MKSQEEHEKHNAVNYPGTRQMCAACDQPTGRCEDDSMYNENVGPLCMECVAYGKGESRMTPEKIALKTLIDPAKVSAPDWAERAIAAWEAVVDSAGKKTEEKSE